jgi:large subunit ribosomal protein L9
MKKRKKEKRIPVLLLEDLPNLGQRGEVVLVKSGYFRYLITNKKGLLATQEKLEKELKPLVLEEKLKSRQKEIAKIKESIENTILEFKVNKFFKITKEKIVSALKEKNINITKGQVDLKDKISEPGNYTIKINLGFDIVADLKIKAING